ncbi:MAG TPA: hypothetical protein VIJ19_01840 [Opitutaceae bacterium]
MKSLLSPLFCAAGLAALVLSSGCDTEPVRIARTTQTVTLMPDHPVPPIDVEVVTNVKIVLPGPEVGSGLIWEIVSNNTKVLDQTTPLKLVTPAAIGDKPMSSVTFYSLKPGKSTLRFVLVHPDEAEAVPLAKCALVVRVNDD